MSKPIILGIQPEHLKREGLTGVVEPWEDGLRADTGPGSFEWWYFDAHLDDGSTAVVSYMTKGLLQRNDPLTPIVGINITPPHGRKQSVLKAVPAREFYAAKDRCNVRMGSHRAEFCGPAGAANPAPVLFTAAAPWRYEIDAEADGLGVHLRFTGIVPPWRPAGGLNYYSTDLTRYFAWLPAIPFGSVTGTLTYDGQAHAVTGTGYHDHNWGNVGLDAVIDHWYWGRAHVGDYSLIFVDMVSNAAYGGIHLPVFLLAKGDRVLAGDGLPLRLQTAGEVRHPSGRSYPAQLDWSWQTEQGSVRLALRNPHPIEAASLLELLPRWKRVLARLVANPYYFRFNADLELTVDLEGHEVVRGPALYEIMLLR